LKQGIQVDSPRLQQSFKLAVSAFSACRSLDPEIAVVFSRISGEFATERQVGYQ